jgi:hypothetical protein
MKILIVPIFKIWDRNIVDYLGWFSLMSTLEEILGSEFPVAQRFG